MSVNVTQHYKSIPHLWKWFHVKMTKLQEICRAVTQAPLGTPHICSGAEATNPLLALPPWLLDAVVDLRICQWMSLWLKDVCCSNRDACIRVDTSLNKNCEVSLRCVAVLPISDAPQFRRAPWNCIFTEQISTRIVYIMYEYIN